MPNKTCTKCHVEKPISEFYAQKGGRFSVHSRCKTCESIRGKVRYAAYEALMSPERKRRKNSKRLERNFGITVDDYEALFEMQQGCCRICGGQQESKKLAVDHDHQTGRVRGLLCSACNQALGLFGDNPDVLRAAAAYLERETCRKKTPS